MKDKPVPLPIDDPHFLADLGLLVRCKKIGHLAGIEQVADVLEEGLLLDLRVHEEEDCMQIARCALLQDVLQILVPVVYAVLLRYLHLEKLIVGYMRRQLRQGLSSGTAHADQKSVVARLHHYPANLREMLYRESEGKLICQINCLTIRSNKIYLEIFNNQSLNDGAFNIQNK